MTAGRVDALADDAVLLVEDKWARSEDPEIVSAWAAAIGGNHAIGSRQPGWFQKTNAP